MKTNNKIKFVVKLLIVIFILFVGLVFLVNKWLEGQNGIKSLPCKAASAIELGSPVVGGPTAEFTTSGGPIYVISRRFKHGGILTPNRYFETIHVGFANVPPIWRRQDGTVANEVKKASFYEGNYGKLDLEPGRYWLWSGGGDVAIYSCEAGVISDPLPTNIGEPTSSAAIACGGNYNADTIKSSRLFTANHPSTEFTVAEESLRQRIAFRNIGSSGSETSVDVYIGGMDKLPDWNDSQSILSNAVSKFTANKDVYYLKDLLTPGRSYWLWTSKDADIEFMNCVPENSSN